MAVKIRLMRTGKKKQPTYRVVVADSRSPRDGRFIEVIGRYDPRQEPSLVEIDNVKALGWLRNGAQPTAAVATLLEISGAAEDLRKENPTRKLKKDRPKRDPAKKIKRPRKEAAKVSTAPAQKAPAAETKPDAAAETKPDAAAETKPDAAAETKPAEGNKTE